MVTSAFVLRPDYNNPVWSEPTESAPALTLRNRLTVINSDPRDKATRRNAVHRFLRSIFLWKVGVGTIGNDVKEDHIPFSCTTEAPVSFRRSQIATSASQNTQGSLWPGSQNKNLIFKVATAYRTDAAWHSNAVRLWKRERLWKRPSRPLTSPVMIDTAGLVTCGKIYCYRQTIMNSMCVHSVYRKSSFQPLGGRRTSADAAGRPHTSCKDGQNFRILLFRTLAYFRPHADLFRKLQ